MVVLIERAVLESDCYWVLLRSDSLIIDIVEQFGTIGLFVIIASEECLRRLSENAGRPAICGAVLTVGEQCPLVTVFVLREDDRGAS